MNIPDLILFLISLPMDTPIEVHDERGPKEIVEFGILTKKRVIGGDEEKVFVIRVKEKHG